MKNTDSEERLNDMYYIAHVTGATFSVCRRDFRVGERDGSACDCIG